MLIISPARYGTDHISSTLREQKIAPVKVVLKSQVEKNSCVCHSRNLWYT